MVLHETDKDRAQRNEPSGLPETIFGQTICLNYCPHPQFGHQVGAAFESCHSPSPNYVGVKTLDLLRGIAKGVSVTIYSEEWGDEKITPAIKADFEKARPDVSLNIDRPNRKFHDRYIFLDYGLPGEKLFLCGASSKDAGNKVTTIMQIECPETYRPIIEALKKSSATGVLGGGTP